MLYSMFYGMCGEKLYDIKFLFRIKIRKGTLVCGIIQKPTLSHRLARHLCTLCPRYNPGILCPPSTTGHSNACKNQHPICKSLFHVVTLGYSVLLWTQWRYLVLYIWEGLGIYEFSVKIQWNTFYAVQFISCLFKGPTI